MPRRNPQILRRTFEAINHPKGSAERKRLNGDTLTSEYYPSKPWLLRTELWMSDGTRNPQQFSNDCFTTKAKANLAMADMVNAGLNLVNPDWSVGERDQHFRDEALRRGLDVPAGKVIFMHVGGGPARS